MYCKSLDNAIQRVYHPAAGAWLTNLEIHTGSGQEVSSVDLVRVSKLQNLRRFNMAAGFGAPADKGFSDRVTKTWAELAEDKCAFACLRSIFLYRQKGVTKWSLSHLTAFPVLHEFCAYGCDIESPRDNWPKGWREDKE
jgi:hypothetical protein